MLIGIQADSPQELLPRAPYAPCMGWAKQSSWAAPSAAQPAEGNTISGLGQWKETLVITTGAFHVAQPHLSPIHRLSGFLA